MTEDVAGLVLEWLLLSGQTEEVLRFKGSLEVGLKYWRHMDTIPSITVMLLSCAQDAVNNYLEYMIKPQPALYHSL